MNNPSDTFFTTSPEWGWLIIAYFFVGGIAGGASFLAAMFDLFGRSEDRPTARLGHLIALPLIAISGILLIWDLTRPERFWHMLLQSDNTPGLMFKWYSPISFGAWVIGIYGLFAFLCFVGSLAEMGRLPRALRELRNGSLGRAISAISGLLGLFVAGYTGVLLAATNRPLWADTTMFGLLFLLSGVSAAAALLTLLGARRSHPASIRWLSEMDFYTGFLELAVLAMIAISLGAVAREVWGNAWGVLLVVGVVLLGIVVPMLLHWRPRLLGRLSLPGAAVLVIVGSFLLRTVVVLSSERV